MAIAAPLPKPTAEKWGEWTLTVLFLVPTAIVFFLIYLALPAQQHYSALITIGVLSLLLCFFSYLAEALSRQPTAQRSLAWGFYGMGFAILFLSLGLGPSYGAISMGEQLIGLVGVLLALFASVGFILWRRSALRATRQREVPRAAWRAEPSPNALNYATANAPSVPTVPPAWSEETPPSPGKP